MTVNTNLVSVGVVPNAGTLGLEPTACTRNYADE